MGFVRCAAEIEAEATMVETTKSPEKRRRSYYQLKDRALRVGTFKSGAMRGQARAASLLAVVAASRAMLGFDAGAIIISLESLHRRLIGTHSISACRLLIVGLGHAVDSISEAARIGHQRGLARTLARD